MACWRGWKKLHAPLQSALVSKWEIFRLMILIMMTSVNRFLGTRKINLHSFRDLRWWIFPEKVFHSYFLRRLRQLCENGNRLFVLHEFDKMKIFSSKISFVMDKKYDDKSCLNVNWRKKRKSALKNRSNLSRLHFTFFVSLKSSLWPWNFLKINIYFIITGCHSLVVI